MGKDSPVVGFTYGIGSVIFIGRMLYGKEKATTTTAAETWHIYRFGGGEELS